MAVGQLPTGVGQVASSPFSYANILKTPKAMVKHVLLKPISYLHGEPIVLWDQSEVDQMIGNESLQYAIIYWQVLLWLARNL